ncbi:MAG: HD-GYP domain-containing protein [Dehalococcoidia bacterium]
MAARASPIGTVQAFIALMFGLGAVAFTSSFATPIDDWAGIFLIVGMTALSEWLSVRLYFDGRVSVGFVILVFSVLSFGAPGAALVATTTAISVFAFSERSRQKLVFNFGQHNAAALAAAAVASISGLKAAESDVFMALGAGALVAVVLFTITSVAVSMVMSLSTGRGLVAVYNANFSWLFPHYAALGLVGGGIALAYERLGLAGVIVLSLPLLLSRYSIKQVLDKTRDNVLRLERSNEQLQSSYIEIRNMSDELEQAYTGTLESLVAALDVRDQETRGHSSRVATHSLDLAQMLGFKDEHELATIYRGALMHDVGKIGVPDAILLKPDKLTEEEWEFMRRHPAMGYRILAQVPYLRPTAKIVLAHHERWDGDGYPRRLKAEDIPLGARIFAICDTYDAIISDRPYRQGQSPDAAMQEILRCAGTQFDPRVVEAFETAFPRWREEQTGANVRPLYLPAWKRRDDATGRAAS